MNNKKIAIISSIILAVGVFLPIIRTPFGSIGFFSNIKAMAFWEGLLLLLIAGVNGYLFFKDKIEKTRILSSLTLILVIVDLLINHLRIVGIRAELMKEIKNNQIIEFALDMVKSMGLSWAWLFLLVGSFGMFYASFETPIRNLFSKTKFKKADKTSLQLKNVVAKKEEKVAVKVNKKPAKKSEKSAKVTTKTESKTTTKPKAKKSIKKK